MDWNLYCKENYAAGHYDNDTLKTFVVKKKITTTQYKKITSVKYVA